MYLNENAIALLGGLAAHDVNPGAPPVATTIFTVPPDKTACIVTHVIIRNSSGNLTTASLGFGWNAAGTDVIATSTHVLLTGSTLYCLQTVASGKPVGTAGGTFKVAVTIAQGGAMTVDIDVFGYYV